MRFLAATGCLRGPLPGHRLSGPKHCQLSSYEFERSGVASPPAWTHFDERFGELVDAVLALPVIVEGRHTELIHLRAAVVCTFTGSLLGDYGFLLSAISLTYSPMRVWS